MEDMRISGLEAADSKDEMKSRKSRRVERGCLDVDSVAECFNCSRRTADVESLLSLEDAMQILGIGRTLLYKIMSKGELRWVQIGDKRSIERVEVAEFIHRNRKGGYGVA